MGNSPGIPQIIPKGLQLEIIPTNIMFSKILSYYFMYIFDRMEAILIAYIWGEALVMLCFVVNT